MNSYQAKRKEAQKKWDLLKTGKTPVIYLGTASCGRAAGAMEALESAEKTLKENRVKARIVQVGCIGPCYLEPLMDIELPGRPRISYASVTFKKARTIIESHIVNGDPLSRYAVGHFGDENGEFTNGIPRFFDLPMLKPKVRIVLRNC
jgi:(2Fe-2S) ferredoxin